MTSVQIDSIKDLFPIMMLNKIFGERNFESISKLNLQLNAKTVSIETTLGTGLHGYLALTIPTADFMALNNGTAWVEPTNLGPIPTLQSSVTGQKIEESNRVHTKELKEWNTYQVTKKLLKRQLLEAVEDIYVP